MINCPNARGAVTSKLDKEVSILEIGLVFRDFDGKAIDGDIIFIDDIQPGGTVKIESETPVLFQGDLIIEALPSTLWQSQSENVEN